MVVVRAVIYTWFFILCFWQTSYALVVGSATAPSSQGHITFPSSDSDNEAKGFAFFGSGFSLEDETTSCTFSSINSVDSNLYLNSGSLSLQQNIEFLSGGQLRTVGSIYGNGHVLSTPPGITWEFSKTTFLEQVAYHGWLSDEYVNSNDWSYDDAYIAAVIESGSSYDIFVGDFDGSSLTKRAEAYLTGSGYSVRWHPSMYVMAVGRENDGLTDGTLRIYEYNPAGPSIAMNQEVSIGIGVHAVAWTPSGNHLAIGKKSTTNEIEVYTFQSGSKTVSTPALTSVDLSPSRDIQKKSMCWDPTGSYLAVGTAVNGSAPELVIYYFNGSTLTQTITAEIGQSVTALDWSPNGNYLALGTNGGSNRLLLYRYLISQGLLSQVDHGQVQPASVNGVHWHPTKDQIALVREEGQGHEVLLYDFDTQSQVLELKAEREFKNTSQSPNAIRWSKNGNYLAVGGEPYGTTVYRHLDSSLSLYDLSLELRSDLVITQTVFFNGSCSIRGHGHTISLESDGQIIVGMGGELHIHDVVLKGLKNNVVRCFDDAGSIVLEQVAWSQEQTTWFDKGGITILGDVVMTGKGEFNYQSTQESTISEHSGLKLDHGMTFKYCPASPAQDLLVFQNASSHFVLDNATLCATTTGLELKDGTLVVDGLCTINSDATVPAEGIKFGDGVGATFQVEVKPGASIAVESGILINANTE